MAKSQEADLVKMTGFSTFRIFWISFTEPNESFRRTNRTALPTGNCFAFVKRAKLPLSHALFDGEVTGQL